MESKNWVGWEEDGEMKEPRLTPEEGWGRTRNSFAHWLRGQRSRQQQHGQDSPLHMALMPSVSPYPVCHHTQYVLQLGIPLTESSHSLVWENRWNRRLYLSKAKGQQVINRSMRQRRSLDGYGLSAEVASVQSLQHLKIFSF